MQISHLFPYSNSFKTDTMSNSIYKENISEVEYVNLNFLTSFWYAYFLNTVISSRLYNAKHIK